MDEDQINEETEDYIKPISASEKFNSYKNFHNLILKNIKYHEECRDKLILDYDEVESNISDNFRNIQDEQKAIKLLESLIYQLDLEYQSK